MFNLLLKIPVLHEPPRRVLIKLPESEVTISDFLFPGESTEASANAVEEMFGFVPELEDLDDEQELVASPKQVVVRQFFCWVIFFRHVQLSLIRKNLWIFLACPIWLHLFSFSMNSRPFLLFIKKFCIIFNFLRPFTVSNLVKEILQLAYLIFHVFGLIFQTGYHCRVGRHKTSLQISMLTFVRNSNHRFSFVFSPAMATTKWIRRLCHRSKRRRRRRLRRGFLLSRSSYRWLSQDLESHSPITSHSGTSIQLFENI